MFLFTYSKNLYEYSDWLFFEKIYYSRTAIPILKKKLVTIIFALRGNPKKEVLFRAKTAGMHCKKELAIFPSPAGMSLTKLSLGGKKLNYSRPGRVWSVTSRLGTGKRPTFFYSVVAPASIHNPLTHAGQPSSLWIHCKKRLTIFLSPDGMSLTKLSLAGNNFIFPVQGEFGKWHPGWGRENR
jgi:hypothetical protein